MFVGQGTTLMSASEQNEIANKIIENNSDDVIFILATNILIDCLLKNSEDALIEETIFFTLKEIKKRKPTVFKNSVVDFLSKNKREDNGN